MHPHSFRSGRLGFHLILVLVALWATACTTGPSSSPVAGRDAFVVLSGGGTPLSNNYSQYLQAKALNEWLRARYPAEAVWTFYGAGNQTGQAPFFSDTRKQNKEDGLLIESWLPGPLEANRPATRDQVLAALKNEILPKVAEGGTLYLFVGDHGELSRSEPKESIITLWQMEQTGTSSNGWRSNPAQVLGVNELRSVLEAGLGRGRVVFCFTCCHSGGFHFLGQPRTVAPNPAWFSGFVPVEAADWTAEVPLARIAGFTATTEDSLAAGCAPDPDPDRWAGSERFIPEALLGTDLMTGERRGPSLRSFAEAFDAAMVVNRTIDKPHSSAEAFLERHATLIETVLARGETLTPAARAAVEQYHRIVAGEDPGVKDAVFKAQKAVYDRFLEALVQQNPLSANLLRSGSRTELETAIGPEAGNAGRGGRRRGMNEEIRKQWTEIIRPVWKTALETDQVPSISADAKAFELHLIDLEEKNPRRDLTPGNRDAVRNELFWRSGSAIPSQTDAVKAVELARWDASRRTKILAWARGSESEALRTAAEKWGGPVRPATATAPSWSGPPRSARKEALQRALFFRRVMGAWAFLLAVDEQPALRRLKSFRDLERVPLPPPQSSL